MKKRVFDIKGIKWSFQIMSDRTFVKKHGKGLRAVTIIDNTHEVHFCKSFFTLPVARHEIFHVFFVACLTSDSSLKKDQVEEVCAKIVEFHLPDIDELSKLIYKEFSNG